jgi:acetyltransferase-like isoleucine patch superfamily enzyme
LRGLRYGWWNLRSGILLLWYRLLFRDFRAGRGVRLGRGVYINVVKGGSLSLGDGVDIEAHCYLVSEGTMSIGPRSFIGTGSVIVAVEQLTVGADALIAAYVTLRDHNHRFADPGIPYNRQGISAVPIEIGDNVWIGTKVTVLKGVSIGSNCIIGANAVVTSSLPADAIAAGIPARVLRSVADSRRE